MSKKTVYITRKQLDEITGESGIYLDTVGGSANSKKSNEVAVDGTIDTKGDGNPITTDSFSNKLSRGSNWSGIGRNRPVPLMCSTITWKDFLNEENENLKNRTYTIPDKLKETLVNNFQNYTAPKSEEGYKRLRFLATHDNVSYRELKRLKNFFDTNQDKDLFNRLGGADTQSWVENGLKSSRGVVAVNNASNKKLNISNDSTINPIKPINAERGAHTPKSTTFNGETETF